MTRESRIELGELAARDARTLREFSDRLRKYAFALSMRDSDLEAERKRVEELARDVVQAAANYLPQT